MKSLSLMTAATLALITAFAAPAAAQDPSILIDIDLELNGMPAPGDASPEETAAYDVLNKYCAACHQTGMLEDGLTNAKAGFGHVLDLRRLAQDPKLVVSGEPQKSKLYQVIAGGAPAMPDNCWDPSCTPNTAELAALETWINALGDSAVVVRARIKCRPGKQWGVGRAYNEICKRIFDERDIEIPFPHQTIYFGVDKKGEAPALRLKGDGAEKD